MAPKVELTDADLAALHGDDATTVLDRLLFPGPARSYVEHRDRYGDLSVVPSLPFWYGLAEGAEDIEIMLARGVRLLVGLEAVGEPNENGERTVMFRMNGQLRPMETQDRSVAPAGPPPRRPTAPSPVTSLPRSGAS